MSPCPPSSESSPSYHCYTCSYSCTRASDVLRHVKTHLEVQPHACQMCSFATRQASDLKEHVEQIHMGINRVCIHCKTFEAIRLRRNKTLEHCATCEAVERPDASYAYVCHVCNYHTATRKYMRTHLITHEGEKPFQCSLCAYSARRKSHLQDHMLRHTGEKPHACACGYECAQGSQLLQHMRRIHKIDKLQ